MNVFKKKSLIHNRDAPIGPKLGYSLLGYYFEKKWFNSWIKRISLLTNTNLYDRKEKLKNQLKRENNAFNSNSSI